MQPSELHIYYAHFDEHSPGSLDFVVDLIQLAKKHFKKVVSNITYNSVLKFFEDEKMIPHPKSSPCSRKLKIEPMALYNSTNLIDVDLIGYVRTEKSRITNNQGNNDMFMSTEFPIAEFDDEWCFAIVKEVLGWYPAVYDIKWNDVGFCAYLDTVLPTFSEDVQTRIRKKMGTDKRVFKHNNCLPCKNMDIDDMLAVTYFYPEYMDKARATANRLQVYWGRDADQYYTTFGREDYEGEKCEVCKFD